MPQGPVTHPGGANDPELPSLRSRIPDTVNAGVGCMGGDNV
jgi:hypothetical protein